MTQLSFFDLQKPKPTGTLLRDKGIRQAVKHADEVYDDWQRTALDFLYLYAMKHRKFSGEMVRLSARGIVPDPPCLRAWGGIIMIGAKRGWIRQIDYIKVANPKAHKANAALWESLIAEPNI